MKIELSESFKHFLEDFFVGAMRLGKESGKQFKKEMQGNHEQYLVSLLLGIKKDVEPPCSCTVNSTAWHALDEKHLAEAQRLLKEGEKYSQEGTQQKKVRVP